MKREVLQKKNRKQICLIYLIAKTIGTQEDAAEMESFEDSTLNNECKCDE